LRRRSAGRSRVAEQQPSDCCRGGRQELPSTDLTHVL
jgi:hypothetical protein